MLTRLLLVAAAAFACIGLVAAQQGATVTLFLDSSCSNPVGQPLSIPLPFSSKCQPIPANPPVSIFFNCVPDNKNTNFSFLVYNGTSDCSGPLTLGIQSDDVTGGCAVTTITAEGQSQQAWSNIVCSSASAASKAPALSAQDMAETLEEIVEAVSDFAEDAAEATPKRRHQSAFMAKLRK